MAEIDKTVEDQAAEKRKGFSFEISDKLAEHPEVDDL